MGAPALTLFFLALLCGGALLWVLARLRAAQADNAAQLRKRVLGVDAAQAPQQRLQFNGLHRLAQRLVMRSGLELTPAQIDRGIVLALAIFPLLWLLLGWLAGSLVAAVALVCVYGALSRAAAQRRLKLIDQMPTYLESVMRILAAGNTLEESLASAAREAPEPIQSLFVSIGRQVRLGASVEGVLAEAADIHGLRDLRVIALAAAINRKYGGSLRQVLKSLITAIRARGTAARELRALTAETRFSAFVLAVIPIVLSAYIFARNKSYYAGMWADGTGRVLLVASVLLQIAGVAMIWRMMSRTAGPEADA